MTENYYMNQIGGYDYQKIEAEKIIDFFKKYKIYTENGATLPKGILFYGEPGNGKTMFANAIAKDSGAKTFYLSDNLYMQENRSIANELVKLFKQAKENAPSIIILDEIDSIIECNLGFGQSPSDSEKETLRVLLTEIDKVQDAGVLVVATGNVDVEELPSALVRNGRIEKHVYIGDPDFNDRVDILDMFLSSSKVFENITPAEVAKLTQGLTCASLKSLVNDVLIKCLANNKFRATYQDFHDPIQVILSHGIKRKSPKNIDHIIYHELGHLVVDYVLNDKVGFVSVESYGMTGGLYKSSQGFKKITSHESDSEDNDKPKTLKDFTNKNTVSIAGLVATELFMGEKYIGAHSDLVSIKNSYDRICQNGLLSFEEFATSLPEGNQSPFGREVPKTNPQNLSKYLNELYQKAKDILEANRSLVEELFVILKKKKTLTSEEVSQIIFK